jgi:hypothetical protein
MAGRRRELAAVLLLAGACSGYNCGAEPDCILPPCVPRTAIVLRVTSVTGDPVADLSMTVSGAVIGSGSCSVEGAATVCGLVGPSGTYNIRLTAPGFQERTLGVTVAGSTPPCGCPIIETQQLDVSLTPS